MAYVATFKNKIMLRESTFKVSSKNIAAYLEISQFQI